jgi:hypothetical protein
LRKIVDELERDGDLWKGEESVSNARGEEGGSVMFVSTEAWIYVSIAGGYMDVAVSPNVAWSVTSCRFDSPVEERGPASDKRICETVLSISTSPSQA